MISFHQISSWKKGERRIRHRFFLRSVLNFGADKSCDWRWGFETPLVARLDTESQTLTLLDSEQEVHLERGSLFDLEGQIFSWTHRSLLSFHWLLVGGLSFILFLGILLLNSSPKPINCEERMSEVFSKWRPDLKPAREKKKILERALRSKDPVVIQTELLAYQRSLKAISQLKECSPTRLTFSYETKFKEILFYDEARKNNFEAAMEFWNQLLAMEGYSIDLSFKRNILRLGRDLAWKAWRIESKEPIQSREIQNFLDDLCLSLQRNPDCFLPRIETPQANKAKEQSAKSGEED